MVSIKIATVTTLALASAANAQALGSSVALDRRANDFGVSSLIQNIINAIEQALTSGAQDLLKSAAGFINNLEPEIANVVLAITDDI